MIAPRENRECCVVPDLWACRYNHDWDKNEKLDRRGDQKIAGRW